MNSTWVHHQIRWTKTERERVMRIVSEGNGDVCTLKPTAGGWRWGWPEGVRAFAHNLIKYQIEKTLTTLIKLGPKQHLPQLPLSPPTRPDVCNNENMCRMWSHRVPIYIYNRFIQLNTSYSTIMCNLTSIRTQLRRKQDRQTSWNGFHSHKLFQIEWLERFNGSSS